MKESESLAHLSDEELIKSYKTAKGILIGFIIVFVLLIFAAVFFTLKKGFSIFSIMPIVFISILYGNISNFNMIKKEMKTRNLLN